jgi:hypothetical protein
LITSFKFQKCSMTLSVLVKWSKILRSTFYKQNTVDSRILIGKTAFPSGVLEEFYGHSFLFKDNICQQMRCIFNKNRWQPNSWTSPIGIPVRKTNKTVHSAVKVYWKSVTIESHKIHLSDSRQHVYSRFKNSDRKNSVSDFLMFWYDCTLCGKSILEKRDNRIA